MNKNNNSQSGQVLLIIILISAVLLTVGLSVTQIGTTDTQITKLEEENKRALAAAEAGLEVALTQGSASIADLLPENSGISGSATTSTIQKTNFASPLVKKDTMYTFYLSEYNNGAFTNPYNNGMKIYYQSILGQGDGPSVPQPILEISILKNDNTFQRIILDSNTPAISGAEVPGNTNIKLPDYPETTFNYVYAIPIGTINNSKIMFVHVLNEDTKIGLEVNDSGCLVNCTSVLPFQGKTVTSTAKTASGVTKKVELFQSYPQIPSDFFITNL